jgi:hypothetical protein
MPRSSAARVRRRRFTMKKIRNYSALSTKSLRIHAAIKVLPGMNGFPSKAP